ncbi:MAG: hypothetical protein C0593_06210, partial [Marinilabiliales bacterium]
MIRNFTPSKSRFAVQIPFVFVLIAVLLLLNVKNASAQNCTVNAGVPETICANEQMYLDGSKTGLFSGSGETLWTQVGGPTVTIADPSSLYTEVTNFLGGNTYTFRLSSTCEDGSFIYQDVQKTVLPVSNADAGTDATYCPTDAATLDGNTLLSGETGLWSGWTTGSHGITVNNPTSPTSSLSFNASRSGSVTLTWTVTNANGCNSSDQVVITNRGGQPISAGDDFSLSHCYSSTQQTRLNGSYAGSGIDGQIGTWSIISGPNIPNISNVNVRNTWVTNMIQGTYIFRWTVSGPCVSGYDEVTVTVPAPTADISAANAGADQLFCDPSISSTVLSGNNPGYINETVLWEKISGPDPVTIVSPNSPVTQVSGLDGSSTYVFRYTISNSVTSCFSTNNVEVSYYPNPPAISIDVTGDQMFTGCDEDFIEIPFTASGSGVTQYRIVSGPVTAGLTYPTDWQDVGSSPVTVSGLTSIGVYNVQLRRHTTVGVSCGSVYDDINVITSIAPTLSNAGTPQILNCNVNSSTLVANDPEIGTGTWSQVSGPTTVTLADPTARVLHITNLDNGLYTFRWLITGGPNCPEETDQTTVLVADQIPTQASPGADQTICFGSPFFLEADPPAFIFEQGTWSTTASSVSFVNENSPTTEVLGMADNTTYTFTWTIENGCGTTSSDVEITTTDSEGPIASDAGPDQCLPSGTTAFTMSGNDPSPGTGTWVQLTGPVTVTITNSSLQTTTMSDASDGIYTFEWQINSGGCSPTRDTVLITIDQEVTQANAGPDQNVCGSTATLSANTASVGTGEWAQISGNAGVLIANTASATTEVSNLVPGVYNFTWTITIGACSDADTVKLFVSDEVPSVADAGVDFGVCGLSTATMSATAPTIGSGSWSVVSGPNAPSFTTPSSPTSEVTGLITGSYTFRWTVTGGVYCPPTSDDVEVTVVRLADAGSDQSYCEDISSVLLTGTVASNGTWTQSGTTPAVATITPSSQNTAIASGLSVTGVYTFKYTISATGCTSSDVMTVTLYDPPSTANAGVDVEVCDLTTLTMSAETPVFGTGTWSKLSGPSGGSFTNANDPNTTFTGAVPGIYVFQWEVANFTCSNADQVRYTNYDSPSIAAAGDDQDLNCLDYAVMDANLPAVGLGTWTIESPVPAGSTPVITSPILPNTSITDLLPNTYPATYNFKWTISNGPVCATSSDVVAVTVQESPTPAEAGSDQILCDAVSVTLAATPVTTGSGTWLVLNKPVTASDPVFDDIHAPDAEMSLLSYGEYELKWLTETSFCTSSDVVLIQNNEPPTTADASGTTTEVCHYQPLNLVGNTPLAGTGEWSQISGNLVVILNPTSPTTGVVGEDVGTYQFKWAITNGNACATSSDVVTVTVNEIPTQALAGPDQILCHTESATLAGNVVTASDVTGEWTVYSKPSGASDPTFSNANLNNSEVYGLEPGSPGIYEFQWSHYTGGGACITTDVMKITVWDEPTPANAGTNIDLCNETEATMNATPATVGTGEWSFVSGPNTPSITTPSSPTSTITGLTNGTYTFRWTTSNGTCPDDTDDVVVQNNTAVDGGADDSIICEGGSVTLDANASGGDGTYSYQWQQADTDCSGTWSNLIGETGDTYTTPALATTSYFRVIIDDGVCDPFITDCATVTVVNDPGISVNPSGNTICEGGNSTMNVTATGGTPSLSYQWQSSPNGVDTWSDVGTNQNSYNTGALNTDGNYYYRVQVSASGIGCTTITSSSALITVVDDAVISTDLSDVTICSGSTHTFDIDISGGTGDLTYTWEDSPNGSSSWNAVGTDSDVYTTASLTTTRYYRVGITQAGSGCDALNSNEAQVEVPRITTQPSNAEICNQGIASFTADAISGSSTLDWGWEYSSDNETFNPVVNGTPAGAVYTNSDTRILTVNQVSAEGTHYYRAVAQVSNPVCADLVSNSAILEVKADPVIGTQPAGATICEGSTHTMSVVASGGTPTLDYQWQYHNGTTWVNAPGTNDQATYTTVALTEDTDFHVLISATGSGCDPITSSDVTVVVNNLTPGTIGSDETICEDFQPSAFTNETSATHDGTLSYQWEVSTTNGSSGFAEISGANAATYTEPSDLTTTTWYRRKATSSLNGLDCFKYSNVIQITVNPTPTVVQPLDQVKCNGTSTNLIDFTGTPGTVYFDWVNNTTSIGLAASGTGDISSFTATNAGTAPVVATITVTPKTNDGTLCTGSDAIFTITVNPTPDVDAVSNQTLCNGATTSAVSFSGAVPGTVFRWTNNTTSIGLAASGNGDISAFTAVNTGNTPVTATIEVTPEYTNAGLTCYGTPTSFTITVNPTPYFTSTLTPPSICDNTTFSYTPTTNVSGVPITFNWTRAAVSGISPATGSGTGNPNETLDNTTNFDLNVTYVYSIEAGGCSSPTSSDVVV